MLLFYCINRELGYKVTAWGHYLYHWRRWYLSWHQENENEWVTWRSIFLSDIETCLSFFHLKKPTTKKPSLNLHPPSAPTHSFNSPLSPSDISQWQLQQPPKPKLQTSSPNCLLGASSLMSCSQRHSWPPSCLPPFQMWSSGASQHWVSPLQWLIPETQERFRIPSSFQPSMSSSTTDFIPHCHYHSLWMAFKMRFTQLLM